MREYLRDFSFSDTAEKATGLLLLAAIFAIFVGAFV
jgi:hypothetical protein